MTSKHTSEQGKEEILCYNHRAQWRQGLIAPHLIGNQVRTVNFLRRAASYNAKVDGGWVVIFVKQQLGQNIGVKVESSRYGCERKDYLAKKRPSVI
jgi:hypothetical protein